MTGRACRLASVPPFHARGGATRDLAAGDLAAGDLGGPDVLRRPERGAGRRGRWPPLSASPRRPGLRAVPRWAAPSYGVIGQPPPLLKNDGEGLPPRERAALPRARGRQPVILPPVILPPVILVARTCSAGRARRRAAPPVAAALGLAPPPRTPGGAAGRWAAPSYGVIGQPPPLLKNDGEGMPPRARAALPRARGRNP